VQKVDVYNADNGEIIEQLELSDHVFGVGEERDVTSVIHTVVQYQIKRMKRKTSCTKTRGEVRGGGRKPYKQKGTGRARQGSITAPQYRGGGIVFGPKPASTEERNVRIPKKMKRLAVRAILSSKVANGQMIVVDKLSFEQIKTKQMVKVLGNLKIDSSAIVMTGNSSKEVYMSTRNIPSVKFLRVDSINVIDMLKYDKLIITKEAVARIEEGHAL